MARRTIDGRNVTGVAAAAANQQNNQEPIWRQKMLKTRKINEVPLKNNNNHSFGSKSNHSSNSSDLLTTEFEINDVRISARNILTKVRFAIHMHKCSTRMEDKPLSSRLLTFIYATTLIKLEERKILRTYLLT